METVVILNNIRSMENVGSIFRTCDAAGVSKVYLVGITPAPTDRFGRENTKLLKSSLGAEESVGWDRVESLKGASEKLKEKGFKIIAIEQSKKSLDYKEIKDKFKNNKIALVFGNE